LAVIYNLQFAIYNYVRLLRHSASPTPAAISSANTTAPAISHALPDPPLGALLAAGAAGGCSGATAPGGEISGVVTCAV
jgi:hypothetical protein